ncbi:MAG: Lrp/AsnC family transcriptional regulator [Planctomycetota bacterium]
MIDDTDLVLVEMLQRDARVTNAALARSLDMAPSAVHQRVRRLEERGVVRGYTARIDPSAVGRGLLAFVHLKTDEQLHDTSIPKAVAELPGVLEVHDIAGEDCYLLKVRAADTDALHELIRRGVGAVPGVRSTRTTIVLKTFAECSDLPLPERPAP